MEQSDLRPVQPRRRFSERWGRLGVGWAAGLGLLLAFVWLGGATGRALRLPLPGPVIGLAALALLLLAANRFFPRAHRGLTLRLQPVSRGLISHLALLFVPAGVGIMTESEALKQEWLPLAAGLVGSTWIGLAATGWVMQRLAGATPAREP